MSNIFYDNGSEFCCSGCGYDLLDWGGTGPPICYECDTTEGIQVAGYVMKGGQFCDGEKRILALPSNHPDARPASQKEANESMKKHGIDLETGHWKDDTKKDAAMALAKRTPEVKERIISKRVR